MQLFRTKLFSSGTTLVFSNEGIDNVIKMVKFLEESVVLGKDFSQTVGNEVKEQKEGFLDMTAAALIPSLLANVLAAKGVVKSGDGVIRAGERLIRAGQDF